MAAPEATALKTADEAFLQPLPTTRYLHKQLIVALEERSNRLRNLVGGSYRDVLGTAETILEMRRDIDGAEERLARVGRGCSGKAISAKVGGLSRFEGNAGYDGAREKRLGRMGRVKLLQGCVGVVGGLLRGKSGERTIKAAKVLVLGRLLVKSLEDQTDDEGTELVVAELKRRLAALRRRFLRTVDRIMERVDGERDELLRALCAYALATNSGARDVMRHFLSVRGEAATLAFEVEEGYTPADGPGGVVKALGLFTKTLLDVQALTPKRLTDALQGLKAKALLKNDDFRELEGLGLDIYERWLGDEIEHFIPYIRHDDLDGPAAREMLTSWAKKAEEVLLQGFSKTIEQNTDFQTVVDLRTQVLEVWMREGSRAKGYDSGVLFTGLRKVINDHLITLLTSRVNKLHLIGTEIEGTLSSWTASQTSHNPLWSSSMSTDLHHGASSFKTEIVNRMHGRSPAVSRVLNSYETWLHLVNSTGTILTTLKSQKWDEDLDSIDDDEELENRNRILSVEDPEILHKHLATALTTAFENLHAKIKALIDGREDEEGERAIFVLRVLRDIRAHLPQNQTIQSFGLDLIPELHSTLATKVATAPIEGFVTGLLKNGKKVVARALWEGTPEMPVLPSPTCFAFLRALMGEMTEVGGDLWSPAAVIALKGVVCDKLGKEWEDLLNEKGDSEGDNEEVDAEVKKELATQSLFDVRILEQCVGKSGDGLKELRKKLEAQGGLDADQVSRLGKGAADYWKRTALLFGLLN
jgi:hypothetical protein